jgi:NADH:ubiquinone oxidoreductase subunit
MLKYFGKIFGIRHKVLVGRDRFGNKYYAIEEAEVTRRIIETKDGDYPSPETIHPLWHLWLKSRIPYPPTEKVKCHKLLTSTIFTDCFEFLLGNRSV